MRGSPARSRLTVVLAVAVLFALALVVSAALSRGLSSGRGTAPGSSFRADESGSLAARLMLERLGYDVRSRRGARLPPGPGHVLIRLEGLADVESTAGLFGNPGPPVEEIQQEWAEIAEWIAAGNAALVCAATMPEATRLPSLVQLKGDEEPYIEALPEGLAEELRDSHENDPDADLPNAQALEELFGADRIRVPLHRGEDTIEEHVVDGVGDPWVSGHAAVVPEGDDEVLARIPSPDGAAADTAVIVSRTLGDGMVILVADSFFISNVRLASQDADNAAWLAVLIQRLRAGVSADGRGAIYFDDRAVGQSASRGVLSLLVERGLGAALFAGLVLLLMAWWRLAPSDAPDRRVRDDPEFAPESFALLRADLYVHCLTGADVQAIVRAEVGRRVSRGDMTSCERALTLLATRDEKGAARVRRALEALPQLDRAQVARDPALWARGVARVWRALEELGHGRESTRANG